ncbi:MAG: hypothetical protein SOZ40_06045 [Ezakiella sp.]|nr:hypothetical protein [Ezakiella sp.]
MEEYRDYKQKVVELRGREYTLQKIPVRRALQLRQAWADDKGGVDTIKMCELILKNVVVVPKLSIDDFDSVAELEELVAVAFNYAYGVSDIKNE